MMYAFRAGTPEGRQSFKYVTELATAFMALTIRDFVRLVPDQETTIDQKMWDTIRVWEKTLETGRETSSRVGSGGASKGGVAQIGSFEKKIVQKVAMVC